MSWIEEAVEEYNIRVYNGLMSPRAKKLLREKFKKEDLFWEAEAVRVDNNTGHDDQ